MHWERSALIPTSLHSGSIPTAVGATVGAVGIRALRSQRRIGSLHTDMGRVHTIPIGARPLSGCGMTRWLDLRKSYPYPQRTVR